MSSDNIEVREYRRGDEERILALFNEVFAEGDPHYEPRSLAEWRWEFVDNPAGTQVVIGVEPSGRVIAQYACLPAIVTLKGETVKCGQGIDSVVHKDYRRGLKKEGAFEKVAKYYFEHIGRWPVNAFGYGFPNQKAFRIGVKRLGYLPIHAPVKTTFRNLFQHANDDEVGAGAVAGEVIELASFDVRADRLWSRIEPSVAMAIRRDAAYLNWRYAHHPRVKYRAFGLVGGASDTELRGIVVTRANWMGPPILALTELIVSHDDAPAIARLLAHVVQVARATRQQRVETWIAPAMPIHATVLSHGFSVEDSPFNLCVKPYRPDLTEDWVRANWWFTIGDSDVF